ncbi:hypothetical protein IUY40_18840 [Flavobacterium sp. ALJ2]|uniref:hypothetical protein n=1 Tax=Flavobacterium sp. ALJ2 TaxID=2786960 RepID=UPI00189CF638|nr:hypothetical protein [Flavobacterium sp. ALJ2]MBF7093592.1 hypothetical protein [Flavobacterium sp. ALJ2]
MDKLEFSANWNNKLDCKCFTTIRLFNPTKHFKGNQFEILLNRKYKGKAVVLGVVKTEIHKLNDYVCYLDTGYGKEETTAILKKIYPRINSKNQLFSILLLKKIESAKPIQTNLFN